MSIALDKYKELTKQYLEMMANNPSEEAEDELLGELDIAWYNMSEEERKQYHKDKNADKS